MVTFGSEPWFKPEPSCMQQNLTVVQSKVRAKGRTKLMVWLEVQSDQ
jgi:hypothetical protein